MPKTLEYKGFGHFCLGVKVKKRGINAKTTENRANSKE